MGVSIEALKYLNEHPRVWFCTPCLTALSQSDIQQKMRLAKEATELRNNTPSIAEMEGTCSRCGNRRTVVSVQ